MSTVIKNVIVLGAGGNLGSVLVSALQESGFSVTALTRVSSTATFPPDITVTKADYNSFSSLVAAFQGQDAIVSAIATFSVAEQKTAIDAAVAANVKRFIPSEFGGDTSLPGTEEFAPFAIEKQKMVKYLKTKETEGLSWTAICCGAFFHWVLELGNGTMGWDIEARKVTIFDSGTQPFEASTVSQVRRAVVSTLRHLDETRNTYVYINSFTLTQNKVLSTLERLSGKKFEITNGSTKEIAARGQEHLREGDFENGYPEIVTAATYGPWGFDHFGGRAVQWNEILGLPEEEDFDSVIQSVLEKKHLV
ncbi:isoflavone reductase [Lipomyces orientalis]|uniref:Isoflavone reductase n=1 Tax=Lipomyces orientalis TaxID=1233043 RepID=A0ACC3TL06_9ASCO